MNSGVLALTARELDRKRNSVILIGALRGPPEVLNLWTVDVMNSGLLPLVKKEMGLVDRDMLMCKTSEQRQNVRVFRLKADKRVTEVWEAQEKPLTLRVGTELVQFRDERAQSQGIGEAVRQARLSLEERRAAGAEATAVTTAGDSAAPTAEAEAASTTATTVKGITSLAGLSVDQVRVVALQAHAQLGTGSLRSTLPVAEAASRAVSTGSGARSPKIGSAAPGERSGPREPEVTGGHAGATPVGESDQLSDGNWADEMELELEDVENAPTQNTKSSMDAEASGQ